MAHPYKSLGFTLDIDSHIAESDIKFILLNSHSMTSSMNFNCAKQEYWKVFPIKININTLLYDQSLVYLVRKKDFHVVVFIVDSKVSYQTGVQTLPRLILTFIHFI